MINQTVNNFLDISKLLSGEIKEIPFDFMANAFPEEEETGGIPVLWLINNDSITPPYGKIARIKV